ncbi:MAG: glycine cleavage system protein H, partial [Myxococcales bacterium]
MGSNVPQDLKYTKEHEWTRIEGNTAIVGITAFAVEQLGDVVFVDLPKQGDRLEAGGTFGVV